MTQHKRIGLIFALAMFVAAPACSKKPDLGPLQEQAMKLASEYAPKVRDLTVQVEDLLKRAQQLPAELPGVNDMMQKLVEHQNKLGALKSVLDSVATRATDAAKSGNKEEVTKVVNNLTTDVGTEISTLTNDVTTATAMVTEFETKAKAAMPVLGYSKMLGSFELKGIEGGIESQLMAFVEDNTKKIDKTTWFNFDRLSFKTGSAELDLDKSKGQLDNLVEIMKAFPKLTLKIGGYTDKTGDAAANKLLSQNRAEAVMKAMIDAGIDAKRLEAEGYGMEFPVCTTDESEACLAQNRRIAIRVTAK